MSTNTTAKTITINGCTYELRKFDTVTENDTILVGDARGANIYSRRPVDFVAFALQMRNSEVRRDKNVRRHRVACINGREIIMVPINAKNVVRVAMFSSVDRVWVEVK
jgi:hypothetical protein